jgi:hypothetical protein
VLQTFPSLRPLLKRRGKLLSGGERNLLGIGRCLISSPKLLILDEPTAGLSPILARLRRTVPRPVRPHTAASRARPAPAPGQSPPPARTRPVTMRADRGRHGESTRLPDPDRHPGDGIRPQLATVGITPQETRLTAPAAGRPPRAAPQPRPWLERIVSAAMASSCAWCWRGENPPSPTANHASCVGVSQPTTSAPTPPSHDFGYLRIRSLVLPVTTIAIQRDPNEVIIGM